MGFCDPRRWERSDDTAYCEYLDKIHAFSSWLLAQKYDVEIFTSEINGDRYAITDLQKRLPCRDASERTGSLVYRPVGSLSELLVQMSDFDYVITPKFHGVVFSHMLGKPVIALSYLPKIDYLMRGVGHGRYCLDIGHFDVGWLIESFKLLVNERDGLRTLFCRTSTVYRDALRAHFDILFGPDVHC